MQQAVIERATGVHLALQDVVLDRAVAKVEHIALEAVDLCLEGGLFVHGGQILRADRLANRCGDLVDVAVDLGDARLELEHLGIVGLINAQLLLVLGTETRLFLVEALDGTVLEHLRQAGQWRGAGSAPALFCRDSSRARGP